MQTMKYSEHSIEDTIHREIETAAAMLEEFSPHIQPVNALGARAAREVLGNYHIVHPKRQLFSRARLVEVPEEHRDSASLSIVPLVGNAAIELSSNYFVPDRGSDPAAIAYLQRRDSKDPAMQWEHIRSRAPKGKNRIELNDADANAIVAQYHLPEGCLKEEIIADFPRQVSGRPVVTFDFNRMQSVGPSMTEALAHEALHIVQYRRWPFLDLADRDVALQMELEAHGLGAEIIRAYKAKGLLPTDYRFDAEVIADTCVQLNGVEDPYRPTRLIRKTIENLYKKGLITRVVQ